MSIANQPDRSSDRSSMACIIRTGSGSPAEEDARVTAETTTSDGAKPAPRPDGAGSTSYAVVARRYRPQRFEDVVGQDHVVQALTNAIRMDRISHAYLFSGTRGVGKTSMARIFSKALNCLQADGPTVTPCLTCAACRAIATGEDIDVIEIDGASNNGVEAVRELRQNASLRPSRSRYKVYYIDEVHMLSPGAFNALLKTLEEPPAHVKFLFATTEPGRIPVTVLSRCQRYDFAAMRPETIADQLAAICEAEGVEADREAILAVARRANGSMRDAQSTLEQLLATGGERLTEERLHAILGTPGDDRILDLIAAVANADPAETLQQLDAAISQGIQPVDLLGSLLERLRDLMVTASGAPGLAAVGNRHRDRLVELADGWKLDAILSALQILSETRARLRGSPHVRLLIELGLVRAARLGQMESLGTLVAELRDLGKGNGIPAGSASSRPAEKKKPELTAAESETAERPIANGPVTSRPSNGAIRSSPTPSSNVSPAKPDASNLTGRASAPAHPAPGKQITALEAAEVATIWPSVRDQFCRDFAAEWSHVEFHAIPGPNELEFRVPTDYLWLESSLNAPAHSTQAQRILAEAFGPGPWTVRLRGVEGRVVESELEPKATAPPATTEGSDSVETAVEAHPLVRELMDKLQARQVKLEIDPDASGS